MAEIYRSVPQQQDVQIGHVDDEGNVFRNVARARDQRVGHVTRDGQVYRHRALRPDERVGHVDEKRDVYRDVSRGVTGESAAWTGMARFMRACLMTRSGAWARLSASVPYKRELQVCSCC